MKNIPEKIYLQIGSYNNEDATGDDFNDLCEGCITWADHRIYEIDIEYTLSSKSGKKYEKE